MPWYDYEPTRTLEAKGGIRAMSRRGRFGTTWWGKRWIDTLEGFDVGGRLDRGKGYARKGQVLSIDIEAGRIRASVLGSRPRPYAVTIRLTAYDDWDEVVASLRERPFVAARLLADALPPELEDVVASAGRSLFPEREADLDTDCSCPDWSTPCKHIAAVQYLLAEEFDRDPFLLLRLRGLSRDDLLAHLGAGSEGAGRALVPVAPPVPLAPDARFWQAGALPDPGDARTPPVPAALPRRLGAFPFWRGATPLMESLGEIYPEAARRGLAVVEASAEAG